MPGPTEVTVTPRRPDDVRQIGRAISNEVMVGFSGFLTDARAATQEVTKVAREAEVIQQRMEQFTGSFSESLKQVLSMQEESIARQRVVADTVEQVLQRTRQDVVQPPQPAVDIPPATWLPTPPSSQAPGPVAAPSPYGVARPIEEGAYTVDEGRRVSVPQGQMPAAPPRMSSEQFASKAMGYNLASLRQDAARTVQQRLGARASRPLGFEQHFDPATGQQQWYRSDELATATAGLSEEQAARARAFLPDLQVADDDPGLSSAMRAQRTAAIAGNVAGGVATGQGGLKAVLGVAKPLGIAYAAGQVIDEGLEFAERQRAQNADYQRVLGGSNLEGFRERQVDERGFRWSQRGVMGAGQAEQLFRGVTDITTDRDQRRQYLDFATEQYRDTGMDVADSLQVIRTASENGITSLQGLSDSLERVTDSARSAGMNTDRMRDQFVTNLNQVTQAVAGNQAIVAAEAQTMRQVGLGRNLQDITFDTTSDPQIRLQAAQAGMSVADFQAMQTTPEGQRQAAGIQGNRQMETVLGLTTATPEGAAMVQDLRQRYGPGSGADLGQMSDQEFRQIGLELQAAGDIDPALAIESLRFAGVQGADYSNYGELIARIAMGADDPQAAVIQAQGRGAQYRVPEGEEGGVLSGSRFDLNRGRFSERSTDLYEDFGLDPGADLTTGMLGNMKRLATLGDVREGGQTMDLRREYLRRRQETKTGSPVVESLLKDPRAHERKFEVQTAEGPRVVDMATAMEHFSDQLRSGEAEIVAGAGEGTTVSEATNLSDPDVDVKSTEDEGLANLGITTEEFEKQRKRGDRDFSGRVEVVVEPSPALAQWFRFTPTGTGTQATDADRYSGTPSPGFSPSGDYPSGSP